MASAPPPAAGWNVPAAPAAPPPLDADRGWGVHAQVEQPIGDAGDQQSQRGMREIITVWLLGLLCAVVALAFTALFLDSDAAQQKERYTHLKSLLDVLVGPVVTLLSSVIGFYFGTQAARAGSAGGK